MPENDSIIPAKEIKETKIEKVQKPIKRSHHLILKIVLILTLVFAVIVSCLLAYLLWGTHGLVANSVKSSSTSSVSSVSSTSSSSSMSSSSSSVSSATVKQYVSFNSSRYDMYFEFPAEFGDVTVVYRPELFNDEIVTFSDSVIKVQYWRDEVGFTAAETTTATSVDGHQFTITTTQPNASGEYSVIANSGNKVYLEASGLTLSETSKIIGDMKSIISNMRFTAPL